MAAGEERGKREGRGGKGEVRGDNPNENEIKMCKVKGVTTFELFMQGTKRFTAATGVQFQFSQIRKRGKDSPTKRAMQARRRLQNRSIDQDFAAAD